ncbi:hypothetical protein D3C86_1502530 [compost metagenome]
MHVFFSVGDQAVFGFGCLELRQQSSDVLVVDVVIVDHTDGCWDTVDRRSIPRLQQQIFNRDQLVAAVDYAVFVSEVDRLLTLNGFLHIRSGELIWTLNQREPVHIGFRLFCGGVVDRRRRFSRRGRQTDTNQVTVLARRGNGERVDWVHLRLGAGLDSGKATNFGVQFPQGFAVFQSFNNPTATEAVNYWSTGSNRDTLAQLGQLERFIEITLELRDFVCNHVQPEHQCSSLGVVWNHALNHLRVSFAIDGVYQHGLVVGVLRTVVE